MGGRYTDQWHGAMVAGTTGLLEPGVRDERLVLMTTPRTSWLAYRVVKNLGGGILTLGTTVDDRGPWVETRTLDQLQHVEAPRLVLLERLEASEIGVLAIAQQVLVSGVGVNELDVTWVDAEPYRDPGRPDFAFVEDTVTGLTLPEVNTAMGSPSGLFGVQLQRSGLKYPGE